MVKKSILTASSISLLLVCWQLFSMVTDMPELVPTVPRLLETLFGFFFSVSFYQSIAATIIRGMAGMFISLIAAIGISFLFSRYKWAYELFRPLLTIMRSVPVISFILLALIFLDTESIPLMIAFMTMLPLLVENLTKGIQSQRPSLSVMAKQFQIGWLNTFTQITYPQLKPFLFSGLTSAIGFGWRAIIMGEVLSQCNFGIGSEMKRAQIFISVPELIAWTIIAIFISFLFDKGINWLGNMQIPIHYRKKSITPLPSYMAINPIEITDLSFQYGKNQILFHFHHKFKESSIYGITAPSGTGKTTLLNIIGGILHPIHGNIKPLIQERVATVFQESELLSHLSVLENIALPLSAFLNKSEALHQALILLKEMELSGLENRLPEELSFGQQQRVSIARALAYPAPLLLMDEPFKGMDEDLSIRIIEYIRKRNDSNKQTILFTAHNPVELQQLADQIIYLQTKS